MITFTSGMPGDGKSYYIMTEIEAALVNTDRVIVTNVELNIENVAEYLHEHYGKTFNLHSRYFYLDPMMSKKFWLHRGTHTLLEKEVEGEKQPRCDFLTLDLEAPGVCYVIDELHEHFNARNWAKTGSDALTYASQHRKLGDAVFFISQRAKQVDSQLRSLSGCYVYMRNLSNRTLKLGPFVFKFGKSLIAKCYPDEWNRGGLEPPIMWSKTMKVDPKGHGNWYDTAAGVGVKGSKADTVVTNQKGISILWIVPLILLVGSLFLIIPRILGGAAKAALSSDEPSVADPSAVSVVPEKPAFANPPSRPQRSKPGSSENDKSDDLEESKPLDLSRPKSFVVSRDGFVVIVLQDGQQLTSADGVKLIGRAGFSYEGRIYPLP